MKKYSILAVTIIVLLATFAGGCLNTTKEASTGDGTGILKLNLCDAPIDASTVTGVYITINEIQYDLNGEWITAEGFVGQQSYNLLELTGGKSVSLGQSELPAGYYVQVRFILDITEHGSNATDSGCYIEFAGSSEKKPLFAPSGSETGFKGIGAFEVPVNGTVEVTADFDIQEAVIEAGQSGVYILKPTIRLVQNDQTGNISGSITDNSIYEDILIIAYEDGTLTGNEIDAEAEYKGRFPKAVAAAKMDEDGKYNMALLEAGVYDLVVAGLIGDEPGELLGFVPDVKVKKAETNTQNIDIPFPAAPTELVAFRGNKGILLEWANNTETDLVGYNVYCSAASGGPYIKIAEVKVSKYNDNGLTNGVTYYYVVTAIDDSNNESVYSKETSATPSG